jgi:GntR family transcriptional regulator, trigonelline degradation regulator
VLECKNQLDEFLMSVSANNVVKGFVSVILARLSYLRPIVMAQPERLKENAVEVHAIIARSSHGSRRRRGRPPSTTSTWAPR